MRHGKIYDHKGDVPLAPEGYGDCVAAGRDLAALLQPGERVFCLHSPARRTTETCRLVQQGLEQGAAARDLPGLSIVPARPEPALRNMDIILGGRRVELTSDVDSLAAQAADLGITAANLLQVPFFQGFFVAADPMGYWLQATELPGETGTEVAGRLSAWLQQLAAGAPGPVCRYVCITHSGVMRAFLSRATGHDPGEPEFAGRIDLAIGPGGATLGYAGCTWRLSGAYQPIA